MNFKFFIENLLSLKIHNPMHLDHRYGQDDYLIYATIPNEQGQDMVIGKLSYSVYQNKPSISMIEVAPEYQKLGVGKKLIARMSQDYPYNQISWGYTTEPGEALRKSVDKDFQFYKNRGYDLYGRSTK
jgi:GNAT superfamily N-acetyltransferase